MFFQGFLVFSFFKVIEHFFPRDKPISCLKQASDCVTGPWPHSLSMATQLRHQILRPSRLQSADSCPQKEQTIFSMAAIYTDRRARGETSYERTHENQRIVRGLRTFSGHLRHLRTSSLIVNVNDVRVATMDLRKPPDIFRTSTFSPSAASRDVRQTLRAARTLRLTLQKGRPAGARTIVLLQDVAHTSATSTIAQKAAFALNLHAPSAHGAPSKFEPEKLSNVRLQI